MMSHLRPPNVLKRVLVLASLLFVGFGVGWLLGLSASPVVNIVITGIWCFKIARTRQKSAVWGFLLLIPVINIVAFFYLAFSSAPKAPPTPPRKFGLSFQTAPAR